MRYTIEELEAHLNTLARFIREREDGPRYVPLFARVEAELQAMKSKQTKYEQICAQYALAA